MSAPFLDAAPGTAGLVAALLLGIAFGWFLERGGMGNARKLAGQFYLTDLTVFKVMFSALVTAMLGAFWLAQLGLLDASRLYVPATFLVPQAIGGVVFGVGFAAAGLCPGTSCVAGASGRIDGFAAIAGLLFGVLVFAEASPLLGGFYTATARGAFTLPEASGLPAGVVVALVAGLALAGFAVAERIERARGSR